MHRHDRERNDPQENQSVQVEQSLNAAAKLTPMEIAEDESGQNRESGDSMESYSECPTRARQKPFEYLLWINRQEFPIQEIPIVKFTALHRRKFFADGSRI